jgi:hypothetical protein
MIGAWYIERIAAGARLDLEVDGRLPPPRMDMGGLGRLAGVGIVGGLVRRENSEYGENGKRL